ncbi:hypothetical protein Tco_1013338, partial [Tanacetum coccineum]
LQALVDGKKIIITKGTVRRDLQLEDAKGIDCLPNATFFEQLTLMGYEKLSQKLTFYKAFFFPQWKFLIHTILQCLSAKTTAWNEFSNTIASAIICLATNQKFNFSRTHELKRLYKGSKIDDIDDVVGSNLVSTHFDADTDMFRVHDLVGDEVVVESEVAVNKENAKVVSTAKSKVSAADTLVSAATTTATTTTTKTIADEVEMTLAQTLIEIKSSKDKGKTKMIEPEKPLKKKDQIKFDEEEALRLQEEFDEEDRLAREKAQQAEEQEQLSIKEKSKLFIQLLEARKKHFAVMRAKEKRK